MVSSQVRHNHFAIGFVTSGTAPICESFKGRGTVEQWQRLDKLLIAALSQTPDKRDFSKESPLRADLAGLDRRIAAMDAALAMLTLFGACLPCQRRQESLRRWRTT